MSTSSFTLPAGSSVGIRVLNSLSVEKIETLSRTVLRKLPLNDVAQLGDARAQLEAELGLSSTDFNSLLEASIQLWRAIAFHQQKRSVLEENLKNVGIASSTAEILIACWEVEGPAVSERLLEETCSGLPKLRDVDWSVDVVHACSLASKMRDPRLTLELDTDQGRQVLHLSFEEAKKLYEATNEIQAALDRLLE